MSWTGQGGEAVKEIVEELVEKERRTYLREHA